MFSRVSSLVIRRPRVILLGWLILAAGLHYLAPPWERVIKDDDLGLFPAESPSVIGQQLLERGFPQDGSSSDLVLIYERKDGRLTPGDFRLVESEASNLFQLAREHPELGVNRIDDLSLARDRFAVNWLQYRQSRSGGFVDRLAQQHVSLPENTARGRSDPETGKHREVRHAHRDSLDW